MLVMQLTKGLLLNLICLLVKVGGQTEFPQLSFMEETLPNHDYITVGSIKKDSVQCHTGEGGGNCPAGNWILPDGSAVSNTMTPGMYQDHSECRVDLHRMGSANVQSGIYHCELTIDETTNSSLSVPVYIGIYSMGQGEDL